MAYFPYTVTEGNITILIDGAMNKIPRTHAGFAALSEHLKTNDHDGDLILQLLDKRSAMSRLTAGRVKVVGNTVFFKGEPLHSTLANKLITMMDEGYDGEPLARFMNNIMDNPSERSRECLFDFIAQHDAPITKDGCFVAFKGVRNDYTDVHSGRFDNSPGKLVQQDRDLCVEDPNVTCAAGLHVCASHYLDSFWTGYRVIAVKVNPRDVVSVPYDYNYSKMRVCEYLVLGDIEDERHRTRVEDAVMVRADPDQNRVDAAEPTMASGYICPEGWEITDDEPMDGSYVIKPGSTQIGVVVESGELELDESAHPQSDEWAAGDIAWNDADAYNVYVVQFDTGTEEIVVEDGAEVALREVVEIEDYDESDDYYGEEDEDDYDLDDAPEEPLTFMHEATGQVFTATQVTSIVDDIGQRGFDRTYGVPRTTVQEWLKAIRNADQ